MAFLRRRPHSALHVTTLIDRHVVHDCRNDALGELPGAPGNIPSANFVADEPFPRERSALLQGFFSLLRGVVSEHPLSCQFDRTKQLAHETKLYVIHRNPPCQRAAPRPNVDRNEDILSVTWRRSSTQLSGAERLPGRRPGRRPGRGRGAARRPGRGRRPGRRPGRERCRANGRAGIRVRWK